MIGQSLIQGWILPTIKCENNQVEKHLHFPLNLNVLKVTIRSTMNKYNSHPFISFFAHLQSMIRQISIGIIYCTYTTSSIQHIMTLDKKVLQWQTDLGSAFLTEVSLSHNTAFYPSHKTVKWKFVWYCIIMLRVKWHAVPLSKPTISICVISGV